jgi:hypothetical protein
MDGIQWGRVSPDLKAKKIIVVCSGRSLAGFDFEQIRNPDYYIITVNNSVKAVPFANAWFTLDPWGLHGPQLPPRDFKGKMFAAVPQDYGRRDARSPQHRKNPRPGIIFLHRLISHNNINVSSETAGVLGLSEDPRCVATGNSGYGAFNVAYLLKPRKILLLGLDGDVGYFYSNREKNRPLKELPKLFNSTKIQIQKANIQVINGSKNSTVITFPRYSIDEALELFDAD